MSIGLHSDLTAQHPQTPHRNSSHCRRLLLRSLGFLLSSFCCTHYAIAQGQDSSKWARDQQVIEVMLAGLYVNANQTYFDGRLKVDNPQSRADIEIRAGDASNEFSVIYKNKTADTTIEQAWVLISDDEAGAVRMEITDTGGTSQCPLYWYREAAQFRATLHDDCDNKGAGPSELVLSSQQLWWTNNNSGAPYELHRAREFTCYADVPGVGGGRDEPYNRYDNLKIHDQGADAWFETAEGRRLGISLFAVDWPINNYDGFFTRDSLVVYILEQFEDGSVKEHGYSFTEPDVQRIGINLKWMLASCFLVSGKDAVPSM
jgi:hypothetical protein